VSAVFVTGTGTDIGKTFITAALIYELRRRGKPVDALKPVASGFDPAQANISDPGILLAALGEPATTAALDRIAPWRYRAPLSPDMAAIRENRPLDFAALLRVTRERIEATPGVLLIEGVGGVMVPLDERHTVLDWIEASRAPIFLVAGSYLGAMSHALTALDALAGRGTPVTAVIINESVGSTVELEETAATLRRFVPQPIPILTLPRLPSLDTPHPTLQRLADLL
jgi:dethiobiotin synthetase